MKKMTTNIIVAMALLFLIGSTTILKAQVPSPALWLKQSDCIFDSTTKIFTIVIEWKNGLIDIEHPEAEGYNVYRSMIGHDVELDDYDLVGTATEANITDGVFKFNDDIEIYGGYFYYVRGYKNDDLGDISRVIQALAPTSYCINLNAEIIDFISFPETIGIPNETYEYQAYARHRSLRVQGWVRYHLVEGPEGMTIHEKTGLIQWTLPGNANGDYYVKIRATSEEDERAESIQEWYIRTASPEEMLDYTASVLEVIYNKSLKIYPTPARDKININYEAFGNSIQIEIISMDGKLVNIRNVDVAQGDNVINIPLNGMSTGTYFLKIIDNNNVSFGKVIVE